MLGQLHETIGPQRGEDPVEHYLQVLETRPGALIAAAAEWGASFSARARGVPAAARQFGEPIGVAFQLDRRRDRPRAGGGAHRQARGHRPAGRRPDPAAAPTCAAAPPPTPADGRCSLRIDARRGRRRRPRARRRRSPTCARTPSRPRPRAEAHALGRRTPSARSTRCPRARSDAGARPLRRPARRPLQLSTAAAPQPLPPRRLERTRR